MKIPLPSRGASPKRTVQGILDDHTKFLSGGGGDPRKAKEYNNCITEPFFNIPLSQVHSDSHKSIVLTFDEIGVLAGATYHSRDFPETLWTS